MTLDSESYPKEYVLPIHRNMYGQKLANLTWNKCSAKTLVKVLKSFQSTIDKCEMAFNRGTTMYIYYADDSQLAGPNKIEINAFIKGAEKKEKLEINVVR
jgi:hypothetical protein